MDLNTSARMPLSLYDEIVQGGAFPPPKSLYDEITRGGLPSMRTPIGDTPELPPSRSAMDWGKDTAIDAAKSLIGAGEFAVGLADIPTDNLAGKALSAVGYDPGKSRQVLESGYSQARQEANKNVADAKGFIDTSVALAENPSVALGALVESSIGSLGIAGAAKVAAGKMLAKAGIKAGTEEAGKFFAQPAVMAKLAAIGAAAEGAQATGSIQEQGRQGGREWSETVLPAILAGVGTAGISFLSSKVIPDAEVKLALAGMAGKQEKNSILTAGKEIAKTFFKEGVLEEMPQSAQEQVFTNLATGKPWDEGVAEAAAQGMVVGALQGGGMATGAEILNRAKATKDEDPVIKALTQAINTASVLETKINAGAATDQEKKEFKSLTDAILSQVTVLRAAPDREQKDPADAATRKPLEPAKSAARDILLEGEPESKRKNMTAKDILTQGDVNIQDEEDLTPENLAAIEKTMESAGTPGERGPEAPEVGTAPAVAEEEPAKGDVFSRIPLETLQGIADTGVEGAKNELARRKASTVVELPAAPMGETVVGGGARSAVETPRTKSARKESDEVVAKYRGEGHDINDHGVYINQERVTVPFSKTSGREGEIRIANAPDGFHLGVSISKKYGDYEGSGYAPSINSSSYNTRAEAIKAGIDIIRSRTKGDDPKGKAALAELAKFEREQSTKIKAAGTNRPKSPTGQAKEGTVPVGQTLADNSDLQGEAIPKSYTERMKNAASADEGRKLISQYEEEFASVEREAGLEHSIGKGGSGMGGRGYSTLTPKEKKTIVTNVTAKNPALGEKIQSLIKDIDAAEPHWKSLSGKEYRNRGSYPKASEKADETSEIKAAGTGGARAPKPTKETAKTPEVKKTDKPVPSMAEEKAKEEEGKAKLVKKYLLEHIDEAITARAAYENNKTEDSGPDHVIIDVPMDGKFRIRNKVEALQKFKKNVSKLKVTAALNKLPQHSGKPVGKSTDLITKEAEAEVADYWTKRNEFKARYEGVPAEITATEARLAKYQAIQRKVDAKEITLKQLGEDAKAAASKESAGPEAWRDSWFGKTPTYADLMERIKDIQKELRDLKERVPNLEARIREFYPGLAKEMFQTKAAAKEKKSPEEIAAAGTGGARGPKAIREKEERKEKPVPRDEIPQEKQIDAVNADIMKEISEISDEELDSLLDMPEKKETAPRTTNEAIKSVFAAARDRAAGKIPSAKPAKTLDDILTDVAKEGIEGAGEALKGLYELFGGASLKTFPGGFDEETYTKAKPHFEAALEHFIKVGKGLREFAESIVKQFGDAVRPYLKQFIQEKRDGVIEAKTPINLDENTGKEEGGARTRRKLTEQERAEKKAKVEAAAKKKARKAAMGEFKNVGYVYDPEKLNQKTKDKTAKSAAKIILDEMVPGKIWTPTFTEEATPGTVRLMTQMQKYFFTFKEYLTESRDRLRYSSGKSIDDKIQHWLTYRGGSIDMLKEWATEYGKTTQPIVDAFNGQTNITNVIGKLQDTILPGERFGDTETGTFARHYTEINTVEAKEKFTAIEGLLGRSRQAFYSFLTDSWHNLIADENDILLSEIDINKRGRNKIVVRSGLPDYREGVELKRTEDFQAPFGFKGVGFGEEGWINQEERNRVIPAAFDSFKDLAATIGAPDKGMSLGGELAVQFANLGHKAKGAAAAYFPGVRTINFTRDSGDGTMAHEWGHGLHDLASEDAKSEINSVIGTFHYVYDFDAGTRLIDDLLAKDSMFLKRMVSSKKQQRIEAVKNEVANRFEDTVRKSTDYYSTTQQMDEDYTARAQEMWARAFEACIYDTLTGKNNYLVNDFVAAGRVGGKAGVGTRLVYPSGKERETFNATINHFLDGLAWDESGKPSLKDDYVTIEKAHELMLQLQLKYLLDQVEARYTAIWASEPSKDGYSAA